MHRALTAVVAGAPIVAGFSGIESAAAQTASLQKQYSSEELGRMMAEVPTVGGHGTVRLSPDGSWIVYGVAKPSIADNQTTHEFWLQRVPQGKGVLQPPLKLPAQATAPRWHPGGQSISFILGPDPANSNAGAGFALYDIENRSFKNVMVKPLATVGGENARAPQSIAISSDYEWSPRGNFVAFTVSVPAVAKPSGLDPRGGVPLGAWNRQDGSPDIWKKIFLVEFRTGKLTQLTSDALRVQSFVWSPDERQLVVVVDARPNSQGTATDLIVVDKASGQVRELVTRPGKDESPLWSPDGRWIAFSTQNGKPDYLGGWPAAIPAAGGEIVTFPRAPKAVPFRWTTDSRHVLFGAPREFATALMLADVGTRSIVAWVPLPASAATLPYDTQRSVTDDGKWMAFVRSTVSIPPELYLTRLDNRGFPRGLSRKLTALSLNFPLRDRVRTEEVSWSSKDGKFTIHGLLITPTSAWSHAALQQPLPTLLSITGGPSMVSSGFAADGWRGIELSAAARGYAVLVPNTRGRAGFGDDLLFGIRDAKSYVGVPFEDAMAGLDYLLERGIADAGQLAICGHSYGGTLAEYALTQTNRFKAAVLHEAGGTDLLDYAYPFEPDTWRALLARDLFGVHDPFDPVEQAGLFDQSAGLNAQRIKTPTLMQFAAQAHGRGAGPKLFSALRRFEVPRAFFIYDEPHIFQRPAAIADDITRSLEWLDFWVRDIPYPNPQRALEYEAWKKPVDRENQLETSGETGQSSPDIVADRYRQLCAGCHGRTLEGSQAPPLRGAKLIHGEDDESLARSIRGGFPEAGMPSWGKTLSEREIRSLVLYIKEHRAGRVFYATPYDVNRGTVVPTGRQKSEEHDFRIETIVEGGFSVPWSMAFLPGGRILVTERDAQWKGLRLVEDGKLLPGYIEGLPRDISENRGLLAVAPHLDYRHNGWIYLSYKTDEKRAAGTDQEKLDHWLVLVRGRIREGRWIDQETLIRLNTFSLTGRIAFDGIGHVFLSAGNTSNFGEGIRQDSQNLSLADGKIYRINDDGSIPADNPFVNRQGALPAIWTYGHRIPQGLTFDPRTRRLWSTEHGPRGGDELNLIRPGHNYGWPVITYGMNYDGTAITDQTAREGMDQPVVNWTPSIGISNLMVYESTVFPRWKHNLFVCSLNDQKLLRLTIEDDRVVHRELLLKDIGRLRDIVTGPDGYIYLLTEFGFPNQTGRIVRIVPAAP